MPVYRPSTNSLGKKKAEGEQELAEARDGHYTLWCPPFFNALTHCGLTHFSIWKQLVRQDSASMIRQLEAVFFKCDQPHKLLTDNDTAFCSREFRTFRQEWGVNLQFHCAYTPVAIGIAE